MKDYNLSSVVNKLQFINKYADRSAKSVISLLSLEKIEDFMKKLPSDKVHRISTGDKKYNLLVFGLMGSKQPYVEVGIYSADKGMYKDTTLVIQGRNPDFEVKFEGVEVTRLYDELIRSV